MYFADRPTDRQKEFMDWEFGVFFHFGIRSFYPGHVDWDDKPMPADAFDPKQLDCEQWIREARDAGARYAILVCKHHDGFANWPTKHSDYSVRSAPWKNGQGDVVREFTDACRRYGLKVGLYYSPAQWGGSVSFDRGRDYDDYFIAQITELLSDYGQIDYLWFDGCGSEGHEYDKPRIIRAIRSLQPDILIFNMWDPDTRWVGNEEGFAPFSNDNLCSDLDLSVMTDEKEALDRVRFLPAECDMRMRDTWFDADNEDKVKSPGELLGIYELSVGRGANLLLNIGPDSRGLLPEKDVRSLRAFGALLRARYGTPVQGFSVAARADDDTWVCVREEGPALIDRVVLREDMSEGQSILGYDVYARMNDGQRLCLYRGATVGHKSICVIPAVRTDTVEVTVTGKRGRAELRDIVMYRAEA